MEVTGNSESSLIHGLESIPMRDMRSRYSGHDSDRQQLELHMRYGLLGFYSEFMIAGRANVCTGHPSFPRKEIGQIQYADGCQWFVKGPGTVIKGMTKVRKATK